MVNMKEENVERIEVDIPEAVESGRDGAQRRKAERDRRKCMTDEEMKNVMLAQKDMRAQKEKAEAESLRIIRRVRVRELAAAGIHGALTAWVIGSALGGNALACLIGLGIWHTGAAAIRGYRAVTREGL